MESMLAEAPDQDDPYLQQLLKSDRARLVIIEARSMGQEKKTSFAADIRPLFRPVDIEHMRDRVGMDLSKLAVVKENATSIRDILEEKRMPKPPDQPWSRAQIDLFELWMAEDFPE